MNPGPISAAGGAATAFRTAFAVLPQGTAIPAGIACAGQLDRFDLAVPLAARMGVEVLVVSQRLVDAVDGWDAVRNLGALGSSPPEVWVVADGDPASAARFQAIATRVLTPDSPPQSWPGSHEPRPQPACAPSRQMVIVVMGSKGGVGKTLVAGNLASRLAALGIRVAAVDLDFESGDLSLRLGLTPALDLVQASSEKGRSGRAEWAAPDPGLPLSLWAAPARPELAALADEALVRSIVHSARGSANCVVVDTPSDADNDLLFTALEDASRVVLVSTLCPGAVRQARVTVELLKRLNYPVRERLCLVLNRVGRRGPLSVRDSSDLLGVQACAVLPDIGYRADLEAFRGRTTVLAAPRSPLARSFDTLVRHVWPEPIQLHRRRFSLRRNSLNRQARAQALPWGGERYRE